MQVGGPGPGAGTADYRAFIYVNGWLIGRYVNNAGPQHQFYVPAGILNEHGTNTLAIAVWGLDQAGGGLDAVSLVAAGDQAGGVPVAPVSSPGYNPAVYGPPAALSPTLAAVPSTTLATSSFTVTDTLRNPGSAPLRSASLSLTAPSSGWTISPSGPVSAGRSPRAVGDGDLQGDRAVVRAVGGGEQPAGLGCLRRLADADQHGDGERAGTLAGGHVQQRGRDG